MHYADQILLVLFLIRVISAQFKDYRNNGAGIKEEQRTNYTRTMPLEIFISYSHNPFAVVQSDRLLSNEENSKNSRNRTRSKRGVLQLYSMVVCATGCNPLLYKGYGCYCGFLGSGYPVDSIDSCCKMHDWCYDAANCPMFLEYFIPYVWTCYMRQPLCARGWSCSHRLCECDRQLSECLRRYPCPGRKAVCTSSSWRLFQNLVTF